MKKTIALLFLAPWLALLAQEKLESSKEMKEMESKLHYQKGEISLKGDLAKLTVPDNFRYLSPTDAEIVLTKMWGNPDGDQTLGMIIPANTSPLNRDCWAVIITYTDDGYVKDSDADKINYTSLLKDMQKGTEEYNKERKKEGYPEIKLVGWATPPRYDKITHKMYWAKELAFGDSTENTLNYNIRVLGRGGVLVLNAVANISDLKTIEEHAPEIVKMIDFKEGNRYADFNGKTDKVAAYGLAALVAGGIAAKAGFFKVLLVALLAAKKFVIIGAIALFAFVKKLLGIRAEKKQKETV
jgi:uncharacterized membrane-anchored protein